MRSCFLIINYQLYIFLLSCVASFKKTKHKVMPLVTEMTKGYADNMLRFTYSEFQAILLAGPRFDFKYFIVIKQCLSSMFNFCVLGECYLLWG